MPGIAPMAQKTFFIMFYQYFAPNGAAFFNMLWYAIGLERGGAGCEITGRGSSEASTDRLNLRAISLSQGKKHRYSRGTHRNKSKPQQGIG